MRESWRILQSLEGGMLSALHQRLQRQGATCAQAAAAILRRLGRPPQAPLALALLTICADADSSGLSNPYHSPRHSLEVGVDWLCLALLHEAMAATEPDMPRLGEEGVLVGLCAAFGHDLDHDGRGNGEAGGHYQAFRLETLAAERVACRMADAGVDRAAITVARCAILLTDPRAGHPILERALDGDLQAAADRPEFEPLREPRGRLICAMLRDADLMPSAGMTAGDYDARTREMLAEQGRPAGTTSQAETGAFLDGLVGARFLSPAGARFQPDLERLRAANRARGAAVQGLAPFAGSPPPPPPEAVDALQAELGLDGLARSG